MYRNVTRTLVALGFAGALAVGTAAPTLAQGIYFGGPGVSVGVGDGGFRGYHRYHYRDHRRYGSYDSYYDDGPYWHRRHAYRYYDRW